MFDELWVCPNVLLIPSHDMLDQQCNNYDWFSFKGLDVINVNLQPIAACTFDGCYFMHFDLVWILFDLQLLALQTKERQPLCGIRSQASLCTMPLVSRTLSNFALYWTACHLADTGQELNSRSWYFSLFFSVAGHTNQSYCGSDWSQDFKENSRACQGTYLPFAGLPSFFFIVKIPHECQF